MHQRYGLGTIVALWGGVAACGMIAGLGSPPDVVAPSEASVDATAEASVDASDAAVDAGDADASVVTGDADASGDAADAPSETSVYASEASVEAAPLSPPDASCNADAPFGDPAPVVLNAGVDYYDARLTIDELTVYFASDYVAGDTGSLRIYSATRAHFTDSFGTPVPVDGIDPSPGNVPEYAPSVTEDGLFLYLNEFEPSGTSAIFVSTRTSPSAHFGTPALVSTVVLPAYPNEGNPFIIPDGSALYFYAQTGPGSLVIYSSLRDAHGVLSAPTPITELAVGGNTQNLAVSANQQTILFSTTRGDPAGTNWDIWVSRRASIMGPWGPPASLPANVNSSANDAPTWISGDGCRLYLQSNRNGGTYGLYLATRPP